MAASAGTAVRFSGTVVEIGPTLLVRLPAEASRALPSRGQVAVTGSFAGRELSTVVEPDGLRGHWVRVDEALRTASRVSVGDVVDVELEVSAEWPEPTVPGDLAAALEAAPPEVQATWDDITPMARWEWVRWVDATANPATRQRRVEVSIDKMDHGKRRPCCFDLASCTDPAVSRSGKLIEPS
jgi:hypothetical protein